MFGIFTESKAIQSAFNEMVLPAKIIIGDFDEGIQIPLTYWSIKQYRESWIKTIEQGLKMTIIQFWLYPCIIQRLLTLYFHGRFIIRAGKSSFKIK